MDIPLPRPFDLAQGVREKPSDAEHGLGMPVQTKGGTEGSAH
jgi:hypothetical protein